MSGLISGNQSVARVTRWNQKYLSRRIRWDVFLAGSKSPTRKARTLFLWNSRRVLRRVPVELFQDDCDESFEGARAGGDEPVADQSPSQVTVANDSFDRPAQGIRVLR